MAIAARESEYEPFWRALEAAPTDSLSVGIFADYLDERDSVLAPGMRWLFEARKHPITKVGASREWWIWQAETKINRTSPYRVPMKYIGQRERFYVSLRNAYKGFCLMFNKAEPKARKQTGLFRMVTQ